MGGFICVALIVIALIWNKFQEIMIDLWNEESIRKGKENSKKKDS